MFASHACIRPWFVIRLWFKLPPSIPWFGIRVAEIQTDGNKSWTTLIIMIDDWRLTMTNLEIINNMKLKRSVTNRPGSLQVHSLPCNWKWRWRWWRDMNHIIMLGRCVHSGLTLLRNEEWSYIDRIIDRIIDRYLTYNTVNRPRCSHRLTAKGSGDDWWWRAGKQIKHYDWFGRGKRRCGFRSRGSLASSISTNKVRYSSST